MSILHVLNSVLEGRQHKVWAEIDLSALERNYKRIKELSRQADIIPVIKADAYGHGALESMRVLRQAGARIFAVATIEEAVELSCGTDRDFELLLLGYTLEDDVDLLYEYGVTQTVFSLDYARALENACRRKNIPSINVHIKLDTGMNRLGLSTKDARITADEIRQIAGFEHLNIKGIFTHFACADELDSPFTKMQLERFERVRDELDGCDTGICHMCNSAGIMRDDIEKYDAVRAGIILYGHMPSSDFSIDGLEAVMSLKTRIAHIHDIEPGDSVSYGASFTADRKMTLATIPIGYADGFIRAYSGAYVTVNGCECPVVGRICMDQCMIDISNTRAMPGDEVIIFDSREKVDRLAQLSSTIPYEVLCLVGKRVPRIYVKD